MIETPFSTRSRRGEAGRSLNLCKQPRPWDAPRARDLLKVAKKLPNHRVLTLLLDENHFVSFFLFF